MKQSISAQVSLLPHGHFQGSHPPVNQPLVSIQEACGLSAPVLVHWYPKGHLHADSAHLLLHVIIQQPRVTRRVRGCVMLG